jgi:putative serine protease PepD
MKIMLIIVTAVLVITAAGSGCFISNLNGQIDDLQTKLTGSIDQLGGKIDAAGSRLEGEIKAGDAALSAALEKTDASLSQFTASAGQRFDGIENDIKTSSALISQLGNEVTKAVTTVADSVLQTPVLYDQAKKSIVRITDGQFLSGSGFIMAGNAGAGASAMKKVVTAYHVIAGLSTIYITLYDGRTWKGTVWASSEAADIAILKFDSTSTTSLPDMNTLPALALADSAAVQPGDPIFVIGSPGSDTDLLGLSDTVTTGIVSHVRRGEIVGDNYVTNLIQIDAAVNFGNSGGPLFNAGGKVIGIINSRIDPTLGDGISFSMSANMIKKVEKIIVNNQPGEFKYDYPMMGVGTVDIPPEDIAANNNTITSGAQVTGVTGPAATAGIKAGDIITKVDSRPVRDPGELSSFIAEYYTPGDNVTVTLMRGNTEIKITVTLGIKP